MEGHDRTYNHADQPAHTVEEARAKVIRLLSVRERSKAELRARLLKDGYDPDDIDRLLEALSAKGIVSDRRFADSFIRSKLAAGWGEARISRELSSFGIDISGITGYPEEYVSLSESERAMEALDGKRFSSRDPRSSAFRFLMSRGFSGDICSKAVRRYFEEGGMGDSRI